MSGAGSFRARKSGDEKLTIVKNEADVGRRASTRLRHLQSLKNLSFGEALAQLAMQ